jgi:hypothetical protein
MVQLESNNVKELTLEQGRSLLDRQARKYLQISGDEFIKKWESGEFGDDPDRPEIMRLVMLIPFAK